MCAGTQEDVAVAYIFTSSDILIGHDAMSPAYIAIMNYTLYRLNTVFNSSYLNEVKYLYV